MQFPVIAGRQWRFMDMLPASLGVCYQHCGAQDTWHIDNPLYIKQLDAQNGGKGIRTPGLLIANETLYQLSYTPNILRTDN